MNHNTIYTIGHSTHTFEEFLNMLQSFDIQTLIDIRWMPGSRKFPQFNQETLSVSLEKSGIHYLHLSELWGRRKVHKDSHNTRWNHPSFRAYADYMETEEFHTGIEMLEKIAHEKRVAYMCSEAVWWRCHRSMVSDVLKAKDWDVEHIMWVDTLQEHPYTSPAIIVDGNIIYTENNNQEIPNDVVKEN